MDFLHMVGFVNTAQGICESRIDQMKPYLKFTM